ncbi:MAG: 50S ribosomal protein L10 [Dehalococcoidia bacterium]|nr:50S ribosomal protein L10 [Dehalococcoidia bacterium]
MPTDAKAKQIQDIQEKLSRATIAISTRNGGATVKQFNELRSKLREKKVEYVVVKNTLTGIAADNCGKSAVREILQGPTGIALGYGEVVDPAKILVEQIKAIGLPVTITGGYLDGKVLQPAEVQALAAMPSKQVLLGRVMGGLLAPLYGLAIGLNYHIGGLARTLEARRKQMESAAPVADAAPAAEAAPAPA